MRIETQEVRITNLINKHLTGWTWKWDRATSRYGCCHGNQKLITISKTLASMNPWEQTKDTVLHEIAHALAGVGHGHDKTWKQICRNIGARPERCYSTAKVATPAPKYFSVCSHCGKVHYLGRMPRGRKYSCANCSGGHFNEEFLLEFKPNPLAGYSIKELN